MRSESTPPAPGGTVEGEPAASGDPAAASIHNIGYRSYEGPRLGRAYARRSLFAQSLRGAYGLGRSAKSKMPPMILFGVMCLPALVLVAVAITTDANELPLGYSEYALWMLPLIGLFIASTAPQSVSRDLRFHTVPLYFSRPIERLDYVLAKYAAMAGAILLFTAVPLLILYAGSLLAKLGFADQSRGVALGLLSVVVFSVLHAGIGLVVAALTPRRGFGVAAIIAVLTIPYFAVTALQTIAYQEGETAVVGWLGLFSPGSLMSGVQSKFLDGPSDFIGQVVPSDAAGACYLLVTAALIVGSHFALMLRYRKAGL